MIQQKINCTWFYKILAKQDCLKTVKYSNTKIRVNRKFNPNQNATLASLSENYIIIFLEWFPDKMMFGISKNNFSLVRKNHNKNLCKKVSIHVS